ITYSPGHVKILKSVPSLGLRKGQVVETYMYLGEGYLNYWAKGRMHKDQLNDSDCPPNMKEDFACRLDNGDKEWWVKIQTKSGRVGWIQGNDGFDGADRCG